MTARPGPICNFASCSAHDFGGESLEGCNEMLCLTRPDVVRELHRSFLEVGVDVIETNSFGSLPIVLAEYKIGERAEELARASARLAKRGCERLLDR